MDLVLDSDLPTSFSDFAFSTAASQKTVLSHQGEEYEPIELNAKPKAERLAPLEYQWTTSNLCFTLLLFEALLFFFFFSFPKTYGQHLTFIQKTANSSYLWVEKLLAYLPNPSFILNTVNKIK